MDDVGPRGDVHSSPAALSPAFYNSNYMSYMRWVLPCNVFRSSHWRADVVVALAIGRERRHGVAARMARGTAGPRFGSYQCPPALRRQGLHVPLQVPVERARGYLRRLVPTRSRRWVPECSCRRCPARPLPILPDPVWVQQANFRRTSTDLSRCGTKHTAAAICGQSSSASSLRYSCDAQLSLVVLPTVSSYSKSYNSPPGFTNGTANSKHPQTILKYPSVVVRTYNSEHPTTYFSLLKIYNSTLSITCH